MGNGISKRRCDMFKNSFKLGKQIYIKRAMLAAIYTLLFVLITGCGKDKEEVPDQAGKEPAKNAIQDFSSEYFAGVSFTKSGWGEFYDCLNVTVIICTNHEVLINMPTKLDGQEVIESGTIKTLTLTDEQYSNIENGIDRQKLAELDPESDNDVMDGSSSYIYLYDKDQNVIICGGYMPTNEDFIRMRKVIMDNIPIDEITEAREAQIEKLRNADYSEEDDDDEGFDDDTKNDMASDGDSTSDDETAGSAELLYQGHASLRITTSEGKVIYVDPFMGDGYDEAADLILITHAHKDHTAMELISERNEDCSIITYSEALSQGSYQSFDLGYVKIEATAAYNSNHAKEECVGYILTFTDGVSVYISGDTSLTTEMTELSSKEIDYAFFCCDGVYNMDVNEATECAKLVNAKHSIPYHMVPSDSGKGFDENVAAQFDGPGKTILQPGDILELSK